MRTSLRAQLPVARRCLCRWRAQASARAVGSGAGGTMRGRRDESRRSALAARKPVPTTGDARGAPQRERAHTGAPSALRGAPLLRDFAGGGEAGAGEGTDALDQALEGAEAGAAAGYLRVHG